MQQSHISNLGSIFKNLEQTCDMHSISNTKVQNTKRITCSNKQTKIHNDKLPHRLSRLPVKRVYIVMYGYSNDKYIARVHY